MIAFLDPKFPWYVARAAGLVAWCMCSASVIWGLLMSSRLIRRRGAPVWLLDLHRYLGTLAIVFTAVHLAGLWFDDYIDYGFRELFVPFTGEYRPVAVAWGIVAFYILVAIQLSSWFMRRLPRKIWHAIHLGSIPLTALATIHGFFAGADRGNLIVIWTAIALCAVMVFLTGSRVAARRTGRPRAARNAGSTNPDARAEGIERARDRLAARSPRIGHAVAEPRSNEQEPGLIEGLRRSRDLRDDVATIATGLQHLLDTPNLSLDPAPPAP